jgi:cyclic pyranopterin phosphate synthase
MQDLSHLNEQGDPVMVDVSNKVITHRTAEAECLVRFPLDVWATLTKDNWQVKKGSIRQTSIVAGIMGVKKTHDLIPLCHPLNLSSIDLTIEEDAPCLRVFCKVQSEGKTGVEMEALTGCTIAGLTIYDMCKALSHDIQLEKVQLIQKQGGKRDFERK